MSWKVTTDGDITTRQGDTGTLKLKGLIFDKVGLEIQDLKRNKIASILDNIPDSNGNVNILFTKTITNLLTVPSTNSYAKYIYFVTGYSTDFSTVDTVVLGQKDIEDLNFITVYPKGCEVDNA